MFQHSEFYKSNYFLSFIKALVCEKNSFYVRGFDKDIKNLRKMASDHLPTYLIRLFWGLLMCSTDPVWSKLPMPSSLIIIISNEI